MNKHPKYKDYDYVRIVDTSAGKGYVLTEGRIKGRKYTKGPNELDIPLISVDYKNFFHEDGNDKYVVIFYEDKIEYSPLKEDLVQTLGYIKEQWMNVHEISPAIDYYVDNDITGVDPEIKDLVYTLNKIRGVRTLSSCCGHLSEPAWVAMDISDFFSLTKLLAILQDPTTKLGQDWYIDLTSTYVYSAVKDYNTTAKICTRSLYPGYKQINKLDTIINTYLENGFLSVKEAEYSVFDINVH